LVRGACFGTWICANPFWKHKIKIRLRKSIMTNAKRIKVHWKMLVKNKGNGNVIILMLLIFFFAYIDIFFFGLLWFFNVWGYLWLGLFRSPSACVPKLGTAVVRPHCSCQHYSVHLSRNIGYLASCNRLHVVEDHCCWIVVVVE